MNSSIKYIVIFLLTFFYIEKCLADGSSYLTITAKDGTTTSFALANKPKITFSNGNLVIVSNASTFSLSLAQVLKYGFSSDLTGINETLMHNEPVIENGAIIFNGLTPGTKVAIYMSDGRLVVEKKADSHGYVGFNFSTLPKGLIIIQTEKLSWKIVNQ